MYECILREGRSMLRPYISIILQINKKQPNNFDKESDSHKETKILKLPSTSVFGFAKAEVFQSPCIVDGVLIMGRFLM